MVYEITASLNYKFGNVGFNPALCTGYIMFLQYEYEYPNQTIANFELNHYLWIYIVCSCAGGVLGGLLFNLHAKAVEGGDVKDDGSDAKSDLSHD